MQVAVCGGWPDVVKYLSGVLYGLVCEQFSYNKGNCDAIKTGVDKIALVRQAFDGFSRRGGTGNCNCNDDSKCNGDCISHFHGDCTTHCQQPQDTK